MINPAVTIGLIIRNKMSMYEGMYCIISQICASLLAGLICLGLYGSWDEVGAPAINANTHTGKHECKKCDRM